MWHSSKNELKFSTRVWKTISKKYNIIAVDRFLLPIENSQRSLVILKNK